MQLRIEGSHLYCAAGHNYPIVDGIPVFLMAEKDQTIGVASASLRAAQTTVGGPLYIDTLGLSNDEKRGIEKDSGRRSSSEPLKKPESSHRWQIADCKVIFQ